MTLWYADVTVETHSRPVFAAVVYAVHGHNTADCLPDDRIAIGFPDYIKGQETAAPGQAYDKIPQGCFGDRVRLFGRRPSLHRLIGHNTKLFFDTVSVELVLPRAVPPTSQSCAYIGHHIMPMPAGQRRLRDAAYWRRKQRRLEQHAARGLTPHMTMQRCQELAAQHASRMYRERPYPYVMMPSRSNGAHFPIYVERSSTATTEFKPDKYGFSTASKAFPLPVF